MRRAWAEVERIDGELADAREAAEAAERDRDWLEHAAKEIAALAPEPGEESRLAEERAAMQAGAKAGETLAGLDELLGGSEGALAQLRAAARRIERGAADHPLLGRGTGQPRPGADRRRAKPRTGSRAPPRRWRFDPARLEAVEARLFDIRGLARKHRVEADALAALGEEMTGQAGADRGGRRADRRRWKLSWPMQERATTRRQACSEPRAGEAASKLDVAVAGELSPAQARCRQLSHRAIGDAEPGPAGIDRVEFEVSTNPGAPFGPLTRIASGGELSRFILALKVALAEAGTAQTMIFDEIDRGVGGAVASAIGERLARLAREIAALVVTHSPQVAARAAHHYRIEKAHEDGVHPDHRAQADARRTARGNRPDAVGRGNHRRSPRPGGAAIGGSMTEQRSLKQEYQRPDP